MKGWVILPALSEPVPVFHSSNVTNTTKTMMVSGHPFWQWNAWVTQVNQDFTWSLGGTLPDYQGVPLAVVVLLEENNLNLGEAIGRNLLEAATNP
jgi:hypothetical protein